MATKNFDKMSSKSLNALLNNESTSIEDQEAIQEVLTRRNAPKPTIVEVDPDSEDLTPEAEDEIAQKALEAAKRAELVAEMKTMVGRKCSVLPFNRATWVDGVVTGVMDDLRAKNPLWVVKNLEDGKIIRKAYGSELIKISEESVEITKRTPGTRLKIDFTPQQIADQLAIASAHVGHFATFSAFNSEEKVNALIISVMHEKRSNKVMYRLRDEDGKIYHKVFGGDMEVLEDTDEKTVNGFAERRQRAEVLAGDPSKMVEFIDAEIAELKKQIEVLGEKIAQKEAQKAEYLQEEAKEEAEDDLD